MLQLWMFYIYFFFKKITDKNFQVTISLMKTKSPDDHQCHTIAKSGMILHQVHLQYQIAGLLDCAPLIWSKLWVFDIHDTGFPDTNFRWNLSTNEVLSLFRYESV